MKFLIALVFLLFICGCQAIIYGTASQFENIHIGMNKGEVISVLGRPSSFEADGTRNEEIFIYRKMGHVISELPKTYKVVFKEGKVIKYGEKLSEYNVNLSLD